MKSERIHIAPAPLPADNNIRRQYPIQHGTWVRHPDIKPNEASFCRYSLSFELDSPATIDVHVSADNRFELCCDGQYVGMGPDRSDLEHWSFHAYRLTLDAGAHTLSADAYFLGLNPSGRPWAQTCIEPGFILFAENAPIDLNTGSAAWKVTLLAGVTTERAPVRGFFVVGPNYVFDAAAYFAPPEPVDVVTVRDAGRDYGGGTMHPGWKLYPSRLPEQVRKPVGGGLIRCVADIGEDDPWPQADTQPTEPWQALVEGR